MAKEEKTNVMRVLDGKKIPYESHAYKPDATMSGEEIAGVLGEDPVKVFKTLVTQGKTGELCLCCACEGGTGLKESCQGSW